MKIALVIAPVVITGYVIGLHYGPKGVALGYSVAMALWLFPHIVWCVHGTVISVKDILQVLSRPLVSGVVASILPIALQLFGGQLLSPVPRLILGSSIFLATYLCMLLYAMGQKAFYLDIVREMRKRAAPKEKGLALA